MTPIRAQQLTSPITSATERWMFAPGGVHTITPAAGAGSVEITLRVDESTADVLNASLAKLNAKNSPQRAFFDKEHDEAAGATAWPVRFVWQESPQPGVYCEHEPSQLGRELVAGKVMRAFSPSFYADADLPPKIKPGEQVRIAAGKRGSPQNPARMTGLVYPACGTLTNNPAFKQILPLWAKDAGAKASDLTDKTKHIKMNIEEKAALQATQKQLEQDLTALRAQDQSDAAVAEQVQTKELELKAVNAQLEVEELRAKLVPMEQALLAQRTAEAEAEIKAAIKAGKIAFKDDATQARLKKLCIEDPETGKALLASMKGSPALDRTAAPQRLIVSGVQVTASDIREELKAYGRETDPLKRGALYAKNISKRFNELMDVPLRATDTYAGDLVVQRTLELLKFDFPILSRITTDFSAEQARKDQTVITRIVTPPAVADYHTTNGYVAASTTTTDASVQLSAHRHCTVKFDANVLASTFRNLFDEQLPAMHYALGKDLVDAVYALITTGNFTATPKTEALVDFDRATIIDMGSTLTAAGVPLSGRTLLLNSAYYGGLMADTVIANLGAQQRAEIITGNRLPMVHGFEVIEAPNLPSTGNLTGFAYSRSALLLATRVPTDVSNAFPGVTGGAVSRVITNPDTGISVLMIQNVNPMLGHASVVLAWLRGVNKGQVAAGLILRSSA